MKKFISIALLFLLSSCSYITDFYIFNATNSKVKITYRTLNKPNALAFINSPDLVTFDSEYNCTIINNTKDMRYNSSTQTFSCELNSNTGLRIGSDSNFSLENEIETNVFKNNLGELIIEINNETFHYNKNNVTNQFQELNLSTVGILIK